MAISRVQLASSRTNSTASTLTLSLPAAATAGNSVVVAVASAVAPSSVTDNKGNVYTRDALASGTGNFLSIWRSSNIAADSLTFTLTLTQTGTGTRPVVWFAEEVGGVLQLDKIKTLTGSSVTPGPGPLVAPALGVDTYQAFGFAGGKVATVISSRPTYYDQLVGANGGTDGMFGELMSVLRQWTEPANPAWRLSTSRAWAAAIANYIEAPGPGEFRPAWRWGPALMGRRPQFGNVLWFLNWAKQFAPPPAPEPVVRRSRQNLITTPQSVETATARLERARRELADILNSLIRQQQLIRDSEDQEFAIRGRGIAPDRPPTADDDATTGVQPSTVWVDRTNSADGVYRAFLCADPTPGAAIWIELRVVNSVSPTGLTGTF